MNTTLKNQAFSLLLGAIGLMIIVSCGKDEKPGDQQHATAALAVIDAAATASNLPSSILIDGVEGGSGTIGVSKSQITYSTIQAGTRSLRIDNYTDTITLAAGKHHSLMLYAADSASLVVDDFDSEAPEYSKIRWMLTGDDPRLYQVDFTVDSVWKNHAYQQFVPVNGTKEVDVVLRRNNAERTYLGHSTVSFAGTQVVTMKIIVSPDKQTFVFDPLVYETNK